MDAYEMKSELGRGAFSVVKLAIHKETGERVAVKIIERKNIGEGEQKSLETEVAILKAMDHPYIIKMKELVEEPNVVYIVMELVTGGELFDKIVEKGCYTEKEAMDVVRKITEAIKYMHDNGVCHRDLKPENLLLATDRDDTEIRIADFGLSKIMSQKVMMQTACGTPGYVAPEVLDATGYGPEVDMWSLGVITYILLCGFPPFYGDNPGELFEQILSGSYDMPAEFFDDITEEGKDFVRKLLVVDRDERYTVDQALGHPWLNKKVDSSRLLRYGTVLKKTVLQHRKSSKKFDGELQ